MYLQKRSIEDLSRDFWMLGSSCLDPVKWQRPGGRVMVARQQVWQDLNEDYLIEL